LYIANVLKSGWITFNRKSIGYRKYKGRKYKSPTGAAKAIVQRTCDGWHCWRYKNKKGEWVKLDKLREK